MGGDQGFGRVRLGLMVGASFAAMAATDPAAAQCVVLGVGPINSLQTNDAVQCVGTTNGVMISTGTNASTVAVVFDSATFNNGRVAVHGDVGSSLAAISTTINQGHIELSGEQATVQLIASTLNQTYFAVTGNNSFVGLTAGTTIDTTVGAGLIVSGDNSIVNMLDQSTITVGPGGPGIMGGNGVQEFNIAGTINAGTGVAISMRDGDDILNVLGTARITGLVDMGGGNDLIALGGTGGTFDPDAVGVEFMMIDGDWYVAGSIGGLQRVDVSTGSALLLYSGAAFGDAGTLIDLQGSARLITSASGVTLLEGTIRGTGSLEHYGSGELVLGQVSTFSGGTYIDTNARVRILDLNGLGTGAVDLQDGATLIIDSAADGAFINSLIFGGADSLVAKEGTGEVTFDGMSFQSFEAREGTAVFTGTTTFANGLEVGTTGRVDGFETMIGDVMNDGVFRVAGAGVGSLTIDGDFTQGSDGVLEIDFSTGPTIDRMSVTGAAVLDGTLVLRSLNNTDGSGLTFLTATGGVTGAFDTIETPNGGVPAFVIQSTDSVSTAATLVTLRPSTFNSQAAVTGQTMDAYLGAMVDEALFSAADRAVWVRGMGQSDERAAANGSLGYKFENVGAATGFRHRITPTLDIGASVATIDGDARLEGDAGGTNVSGLMASTQINWRSNGRFAYGGMAWARQSLESQRLVDLNGVLSRIDAETDASAMAAFIGGGIRLHSDSGVSHTVSASLRYVDNRIDAYREEGISFLRLDVEGQDARTLITELDWRIGNRTRLSSGQWFEPRLQLGLVHQQVIGDRETDVSFVTSGQAATLALDDTDRTFIRVGVGGHWELTDRTHLFADVRHELGDDDSNTRGVVGLRVLF